MNQKLCASTANGNYKHITEILLCTVEWIRTLKNTTVFKLKNTVWLQNQANTC